MTSRNGSLREVIGEVRERLETLCPDGPARETSEVSLSIVIPAYNEQHRLSKTVIETISWCRIHISDYEIVIVDDGSRDGTLEVARVLADSDPNLKVLACPHYGKGAAVRMGMLNASGRYVLFMDADGATPLDEILKLSKKIDGGYAGAIGSRVVVDPGETTVETSLHRKVIGRIFANLVKLAAVGGYRDTQCGFKMFRREAARELFMRQRLNGFAFDVELLHIAERLSLRVAEVPVNWVNQEESKVDLFRDSIRMFLDMLKIRAMHWNTR